MRWTGKNTEQIDFADRIEAYKAKQEPSETAARTLPKREIDRMDRNAEILRLWDMGISKVKISQRFGIGEHTVARIIKEAEKC
jgi:predicted DNA-binding protein (UPF0251 family)